MIRYSAAELGIDLLIYINKRGRDLYSLFYRKTEPVSLARFMIRVLPYYYCFYVLIRSILERIEDIVLRRKNYAVFTLKRDPFNKSLKIRLLKLFGEKRVPGIPDHRSLSHIQPFSS